MIKEMLLPTESVDVDKAERIVDHFINKTNISELVEHFGQTCDNEYYLVDA